MHRQPFVRRRTANFLLDDHRDKGQNMRHIFSRLKPALTYILIIILLLAGIFLAVRFLRFGFELRPWEETEEAGGEGQEETFGERPEESGGPEETEREWMTDEEPESCPGPEEGGEKGEEPETAPEAVEESPPDLMLASDLHYLSPGLHDDGPAFWKMVEEDDGKPSQYSEEMTDALLAEAARKRPDALILSGDLTHNGERQNHLELAEKLRKLQEEGATVLVIPGNHDIQNPIASAYFGEERQSAANLKSGEEFYEVYREFGYDDAVSRDEASLSYVYALDDDHWVMMLDSCQYEDRNHVGGRIGEETLSWMEDQLKLAEEQGISVLPVAHHNLLSESRMYKTECTLENNQEVISLLEQYRIPLYVSGHLHAQRIKKHKKEPGTEDGEYGITEIVLGPYSIPPCEYGYLSWDEEDRLSFQVKEADVAAAAAAAGSQDKTLLCFGREGTELVRSTIRRKLEQAHFPVSEEMAELMETLYANLYVDYCAGFPIDRRVVTSTRGYGLWMRAAPDSRYVREMEEMMLDTEVSHRQWSQQQEKPSEEEEPAAEPAE